ncbi:hypothetical protein LCGC14_1295450 [marine sediment metagenome]|uniref:Uncharacterized protein n=1 Tax=marine sediment metagenome TaxID=412755 RepID=A0A0F9KRG5_9ZZZZ
MSEKTLSTGDLVLIPTPNWIWKDIHVVTGRLTPATTDDKNHILAHVLYPSYTNDYHICTQLIFATGVWDCRNIHTHRSKVVADFDIINALVEKYGIRPDVWKHNQKQYEMEASLKMAHFKIS